MAIFTGIATALLAGTFLAGTIAVPLLAGGLALGASYAIRALTGVENKPAAQQRDNFSAQGTLQAAGDLPRSFLVGYSSTAGSLAYFNDWGNDGETPNAYHTRVIALSDLPVPELREVWIFGQKCTLGPDAHPDFGHPVVEYNRDGRDHLWIKYYDGTQTAADPFLVGRVSSAERPYANTRVGHGIAYAICTSLTHETLYTGVPDYIFATSGVRLYDPSKDTSVGGSGPQRWSDRATWGGDGDHFPAVQLYNVLRGFSYNGQWVYGLQSMAAARLPTVNWIVQINKCRAGIQGADGIEPTYRAGGQINVSAQTANTARALLTACQGRLSEIGGFYKMHCGAPDSPTFAWTDADLRTDEPQIYNPFPSLSASVNGIVGRYPCPEEAWNPGKVSPAYTRPELQDRDGGRELFASPSYDFVPYAGQVQRLNKSALDEAARGRSHVLPFMPLFWFVEPGDVGSWTSERNGYDGKLFRVDSGIDKKNLDITLRVTEVDPEDYDWDHDTDYRPVTNAPTVFPRPAPQGIIDAFAEPWEIKSGGKRRPAIRLGYAGDMPGVIGVAFSVRKAEDASIVHHGTVPELAFPIGATIISQGLIANTDYEVQAQYIPSAPRDMIPSDWLAVTTPNVLLSIEEFDEAVAHQVTEVFDAVTGALNNLEARFSTLIQQATARTQLDKKMVQTQLQARSANALARIEETRLVAVSAEAAVAELQSTVGVEFGEVRATVIEHTSAIATLDGYAAGSWGVAIDINGNVTGIVLANDSDNFSVFSVTANNFRVAFPGAAGGAPVEVFTIANVNGVPKIVWRGDMVGDGLLTTPMIAAGAITTIKLDAQAVTAGKIQAGAITSDSGVIGALGVKSLSIGDSAVTVPQFQALSNNVSLPIGPLTVLSFTVSIDTTGLAGKPISLIASTSCSVQALIGGPQQASIIINGATVSENGQNVVLNTIGTVSSTGGYTFTASGGVQNIPVRVDILGTQTSLVGQRILTVLAAKR